MRRPSDCFDRCTVVGESIEGCLVKLIPHHEFVVVSAGRKLTIFCVPLQTTDLLLMTRKAAQVLIRRADITMKDKSISRAGGENMIIPCQSTDTICMSNHCSKTTAMFGVPYLYKTFARANREVCSLEWTWLVLGTINKGGRRCGTHSLNPVNASDGVVFELAEFCYSSRMRIPHVDRVS